MARISIAIICILANATVFGQLTGTKNIPGDYANLGLAIAALNTNGVGAGGVVLNVIAGNNQSAPAAGGTGSVAGAIGAGYVINVTTNAPTASNPVTIQGNGNTVTAAALSTGNNYGDALFTIAGTSYVTINNFILKDNASNTTAAASNNMTEFGVAIVRGNSTTLGSQYCTVSNCTIQLSIGATYTNAVGIYSNSSNSFNAVYTTATAATSAAGSNSYNSFYANTITGVTSGILLIGTAAFNDVGNTVGASGQGNNITLGTRVSNMSAIYANYVKTRQDGIFTLNNNSFAINYNTIKMVNGGSTNSPDNGIFTSTSAAGAYTNTITYNNIRMATATAAIVINGINNASGNASATLKCNYNTIHDTSTTGQNLGIQNSVTQVTSNVNNNNITLQSSTVLSEGIFESSSSATVNINTDTISIVTTTGQALGINRSGAGVTNASMDNNVVTMSNGATATNTIAMENTGTATNLEMNGNTITVTTSATTSGFTIYDNAVVSSLTISGNNVTNNLNGTASVSCIRHDGSTTVSAYIGNNTVRANRTTAANFFGIYCHSVAGGDSLLYIYNNNVICSAGSGQAIGIFNIPGALERQVGTCGNTIDISTTGATAGLVAYIYQFPTGPDHNGVYDSISNNIFKSTSGLSNTTGSVYLVLGAYPNPLDYLTGNKTSGTITKSGSGAASFYGVTSQGSTAISSYNTTYISNNNISNVHLTGTDNFFGAYCAISSSQTMVISTDTFTNNVTGTGNFSGVIFDYCSATTQVSNNYINNNSGGGNFVGITNEFTLGTASTAATGGNVFGNIISNLSSSGASAQIYGILENSTATNNAFNIYNDTITNLSASGNTAPVIYGIYTANALTCNAYNNLIHDFSTTTTSGSATINCFYSGSGTTNYVYGNDIYNISAGTSAGTSTQVIGLNFASAATTYYAYNNFLTGFTASSSTNPNSIIGIYAQSNGSTFNTYYNTIWFGIGGAITSSGGNFGAAGVLFGNLTTTALTLKNNLIHMNVTPTGSGISAAVQRNFAGTAFTPVSASFFNANNNLYYTNASTKNYLYVDDVIGGGGTPVNGYALSGLTPSGTNNIVNDGNFNFCSGAYKAFLGSGRESSTYTENNLSAGAIAGTYAPTSTSLAYGTATPISSPAITTDFFGVTRNATTPNIGASEFAGAAGSNPPVITYTTLNAISYCLAVPPTLTATITSSAGINTTAGTKPRLYYRGSSDADAYGGSNNSSFNGWKYVEASNSSSPFTFTINYSLLNHTAAAGTVISYFVIAQDNAGSPLVGTNQVAFASGYCPTSVSLAAGAAPTGSSPTVNSYTITSTPSFTSTVSPGFYCGTSNLATLTVTPGPSDLQIQWLQDFGTGSFSNISGATTNAYGATPPAPPAISTPSATNVYKAQLSCNSSIVATSSTASATDFSPQVTGSTAAARCGTGTVTLGATGSTGSTLEWFAASTGGYPLSTGTSYTTPSISSTTTFYVADSFGTYGNPQSVGSASLSGATLFAPAPGPGTGINFTVNNTCTIQSVTIYPYYSGATAAYQFTISVYSGATIVQSYTGTVAGAAGGGTAQVVPVNFYLTPGSYQMAFSALGANAAFQYGDATNSFPYSTNFNTITLTSTTFAPYYFFFHNWQVKAGCLSARTAVTATINPLPTAGTITASPNPVCQGSSVTLTETGTPVGSGTMTSYAWSGPNGYTSTATATSVANPVFTPTTTAASGIYSLTVTYPGTGCTSTAVTTSYETVNATTSATLSGTTNACVGATSTLSATIASGTWSSASPSIATIDASTGVVTGVHAGSATISYTTPCGSVSTTTFTVNTTPSVITGQSTICISTSTTLSDSVGTGTWTSGTPSVATIGSSTGVATAGASSGVTTITYTIGSCTANFTLTVGSTSPSAISPTTPTVCVGQTTTLNDPTGGGVWSSSNTAQATVDASTGVVTGVSSGTPTISYSTGCGSSTVTLTVNGATVSASNNGPICSGSSLSLTGTVSAGGTYSWTGPNSFTSTSLSPVLTGAASSVAGTYSFSVTVSGCTTSANTFAIVDTLPQVSASASPATICAGNSTTLQSIISSPTSFTVLSVPYSLVSFTPTTTLTSASAWSADNDDGSVSVALPFNFTFYGVSYSTIYISANGYVNFGPQVTSGDYTAATLPSSAAGVPRSMIALFWHDTKVTSGSVTYGTTGTIPNRKFVISYNAIPDGSTSQTNSGEIILYETSNIIDLMVTKTSTAYSQTCGVQNSTGTSALTPPGENNASYSVTGSGQGWRFETPSYTYAWSPSGTLSSATVASPVSSGLSSTQIFTVTTADANSSCAGATNNTTVTVNPLPTVYAVTGGGNFCSVPGSGVHVGLANSQTGVNYQLYRTHGTVTVGSPISGTTGSAIDFGAITVVDTYTVVAKNATTNCPQNMSGNAIVTMSTNPTAYALTGGNGCTATGVTIGVANSQTGVNYQLYRGVSTVGSPVGGTTGSPVSFGSQTTAGTYTVVATGSGGCTTNMTGSIVINTSPTVHMITGGNGCTSNGVTIGMDTTESGVSYQLYNGVSTVGSPVSGTGSAITFGLQTAAGTYTIVGTGTGGCNTNMGGSIVINTSPTAYTVTGGNGCSSSSITVGVSNSQSTATYQLYRDLVSVGSSVAGTTGSPVSLGSQSISGVYTVRATGPGGCVTVMTGADTVNASPTAFSVTGGGNYCGSTPLHVGLSGSESTASYQLYVALSPTLSPFSGTGSSLDFGTFTTPGSYTVVATGPGSCTTNMTGSATITNSAVALTLGANPALCTDATVAYISYTGATGSPTNYSITFDSVSLAGGFINVTGASMPSSPFGITIPSGVAAGTYGGTLTATNGLCTSPGYTFSIIVVAYPTAHISSANSPCAGYSSNVVFTGTTGASMSYKIDAGSPVTTTLSGGSYSLATGVITSSHNYELVNVFNGTCTTVVDSTVTLAPIQMQWAGGVSGHETDWATDANWSCGFVPTVSDDVNIPSGTTFGPAITSGTYSTRALSIASTATVAISSGATLNVKGDLANNGSVTGSGTFALAGTSAQNITGNGRYNNFTLNNSSGATIGVGSHATINSTLNLSAGMLVTNDSLTLNSIDSAHTARVTPITTAGAGVSGKVTALKFISGGVRAYRFIGHPFTDSIALAQLQACIDITGAGGTSNGFTMTASNSPSAFWYNTNYANSAVGSDPGWRPFTNTYGTPDSNMFHRYQGIRLYLRGAKGEGLGYGTYVPSAATLSMKGHLNQGTQVVHLTKGTGSNQDYNMVANPFASPIDIGAVTYNAKNTGNLVGNYYYVWLARFGPTGQFQAITINSTTPYYIDAFTSYQVRAAHNNDTMVFTESNKSGSISSYTLLKEASEHVTLTVYDQGYNPWDRLIVRFNNEADAKEDVELDAQKLFSPDFNFYSKSANNVNLTVDERPYKENNTIPLGIASNYQENLTIKAEDIILPNGGSLYLHDKLLNQYVLLEQGTEYKFQITADAKTQGEGRFELNMKPRVSGNDLNVLMSPNPANDEVKINFTSTKSNKVKINVFDLTGVSVFNQDLGDQQTGSVTIPLAKLASGLYLVELTSGDEKVTKRLVKE